MSSRNGPARYGREGAVLLAIGMCSMVAADETASTDEAAVESAVLIGASYAESWGAPEIPGMRIVNMGRSGEETTQVLDRFESDVVEQNPDAVIIWGHINDIFRSPDGDFGSAARKAKANLEEMITMAQDAEIRVLVATEVTLSEPRGFVNWVSSVVGRAFGKVSYQTRISRHVQDVNDFLRELAARDSLTVLDFERALAGEDGRRRSEYTKDDGSHINDAGYAALTAYATAQLRGSR